MADLSQRLGLKNTATAAVGGGNPNPPQEEAIFDYTDFGRFLDSVAAAIGMSMGNETYGKLVLDPLLLLNNTLAFEPAGFNQAFQNLVFDEAGDLLTVTGAHPSALLNISGVLHLGVSIVCKPKNREAGAAWVAFSDAGSGLSTVLNLDGPVGYAFIWNSENQSKVTIPAGTQAGADGAQRTFAIAATAADNDDFYVAPRSTSAFTVTGLNVNVEVRVEAIDQDVAALILASVAANKAQEIAPVLADRRKSGGK